MDIQTLQSVQNQAAGINSNGTTTPSHVLPVDQTARAAKSAAQALLGGNAPTPQTPDVGAIQEAIRQQQDNKSKIADAVSQKLNPQSAPVQPQTVADVTNAAEPVVIATPEATDNVMHSDASVDEEISLPPEAELNPKAEDFKKVREALKTHKKTAKELLQVKTELETKVKGYETGEILTEETLKLKKRVEELEPLEQLRDLKTSEAYKTRFIEPMKALEDKILESAKDYGVPPQLMEQAANLTSKKDLNAFLLEHFDGVEAIRLGETIGSLQRLRGELRAAEAQPKTALEKIHQEHLQLVQEKENRRKAQISETSKTSWASALLDRRGKMAEITPRENDPEFNSTWVKPLTDKAAQEYGSLISHLGQQGIEKLDPEFGKGLASMALRAIAYDAAAARADALERELSEYQANIERSNAALRPGIRSSGANGGPPPSAKPSDPKGAGKAILNSIGVKY